MLTTFFVRPSVLARLESGPAGPYLPAFASQLQQQRYAHNTICQHLRSVDAFGRWLHAQGVLLTDLEDHHLTCYLVQVGRRPLRSRARGGSPHAAAALPRFFTFLRSHGVLKPQRALPAPTVVYLYLADNSAA
jgi:site-specific recombinase XerD